MNPSIEILQALAEQGARGLWVWSWQALILLAGVWAGLKLCRVQSPALRHHVWLLGLLTISFTPLGVKVARALPDPPPQSWRGQALRYTAELPVFVVTPLPAPAPTIAINTATPVVTAPTKRSVSVIALAFGAWLLAACVKLASLLRNLWRMQRIRLKAEPVSAATLGCAARLEASAPLMFSSAIHSPLLHGVVRPVILLPHDLLEWTTVAERSAIIEHELAHLRRRDHYTNLLLNGLNLIFYFHPLVRYACREIRLERELACDDCVVGTGADAAVYAESILKAAERCLAKPAVAALHQPAFFNAKQTLERRLEMIMSTDRVRVLAAQWRYLVLPVVLLAALSVLLLPGRASKASPTAALQAGAPLNSAPAPPPPPPPPPPAHFMLTVEAGKPLAPLPGHPEDLSAFGVLRQLADAHIRRDTSVFERLLADGYVGYGPSGESFNKAEEIAEVKKLDYTVTKFEFDDLHVMGNEGIAVASFLGTVYYQAKGQDATVQYRYTATMVRLRPGGPLRVVSIHMSRKA